ncbi:aquaporin [Candidatus Saccharibacteria bacterium]|nr:aquaporin [Candidatus Saccharibacteria bacterium]
MATKKSKTSNKSSKAKTTKPKTATKTAVKTELEAPKTKTVEEKTTTEKKGIFKGFFSRKYEEKESILTIFKEPRFYGALLGEAIGSMFLTLLFFSLFLMGIANVATYGFAIIAILIAVYAFSGACLNPIIAVGLMSTRRISVIRGIMYIIAEVVGAWFAWLIFNGFHLAGGETAYDIPAMSAIAENGFWPIAMVELLGGVIIAFFFSRALKYRRSALTFGAVIAGGMALAVVTGYVASAAFLSANNNFIFNPASALMLQIFPTAGESFGEILGGICQALSAYAIIPMIGGVVGFYLSDFTSRLSGEE